jgi:hypothetical protein
VLVACFDPAGRAWLVNVAIKIPDVVWSGLLASTLTLLGVWVSNRDNTRRLTLQLDHDRLERRTDRMYELRKDVYLTASAALNEFPVSLAKLVDPTESLGDLLAGVRDVLPKVALVGEFRTMLAANELATSLHTVHVQQRLHVMPLSKAASLVKATTEMMERLRVQQLEVLNRVDKALAKPDKDDAEWVGLVRGNRLVQKHMAEAGVVAAQQLRDYFTALKEYIPHASRAMKGIAPKIEMLIVALRGELGIETDREKLIELGGLREAELMATFDDLLAQIERTLADLSATASAHPAISR